MGKIVAYLSCSAGRTHFDRTNYLIPPKESTSHHCACSVSECNDILSGGMVQTMETRLVQERLIHLNNEGLYKIIY